MKVTVIHGSPRKGNTYHAAQLFLQGMKARGEVEAKEFFLPQDMPHFCRGCFTCIYRGEEKCPDAQWMQPIVASMLESDALIFTTPVYVMSASGGMKAFLDHLPYLFLLHRPRPEMFHKQAYVLSTTAGAGLRKAENTVAVPLRYWGVRRVRRMGFRMMAESWEKLPEKRRSKMEHRISRAAGRFMDSLSKKLPPPYLFTRVLFAVFRGMQKKNTYNPLEREYWKSSGWLDGKSPF